MSRKKTIVVRSTHKGKRWVLEISGADREARRAIVKAILQLPAKGIEIVNGASPFGEDPEPKPKDALALAAKLRKEREEKQDTLPGQVLPL